MVQIGPKTLIGLGAACLIQARLAGHDDWRGYSPLGVINNVAGVALIGLGLAQPSSREFFRHPITGLQGFGRGVAQTATATGLKAFGRAAGQAATSIWASKVLTPIRGAWWVYSTAYKYNTIHALLSLGIANIAGLETLRAGRGPVGFVKAQFDGVTNGLVAEDPSKIPGKMDRDDPRWAKIRMWMAGKWALPSLLKIVPAAGDDLKPHRAPLPLFVPTIRIHGDPVSLDTVTNVPHDPVIRDVTGPISADHIGISGAIHQAVEHRGGWFTRVKARPYAPLVGAAQLFAGVGMLYTSGLAARVIGNLPTISLLERFRNMSWPVWIAVQLWSV